MLNSKGVRYLVVGGWAVSHHGYPRATGDIDIWVSTESLNASRIVQTLLEFGFPSGTVNVDLFQQPDQIVRMGVPPLRIEILTSISGVSFEECFHQREIANLDGVDVSLISLKDLKRNKAASARSKDLNDLDNLP